MSFTPPRRLIAVDPANHRHLQSLYASHCEGRRWPEALPIVRRATAVAPFDADDLNNLGEVLSRLGRRQEAEQAYRAAIAVDPSFSEAMTNQAVNRHVAGSIGPALRAYGRVLAVRPHDVEVVTLRAAALSVSAPGSVDAAALSRLLPSVTTAKALATLGAVLEVMGKHADAVSACRRALALDPAASEGWYNKSVAMASLGRHGEAIGQCRRALAIRPDYAVARSGLIFNADFVPGLTFAEHQAERRLWSRAHGSATVFSRRTHANDADPKRRIRLGYVSSDFNGHSAAFIFGSVLRRHDRGRFDVFLYSGTAREDHVTAQFKEIATSWRSTIGMSPADLARRIEADRVDILVDLSGHTAGNHLPTFVEKPAPIQVTAWGHGTGTGLREIDYFFADPVLVPPEVRSLFAEQVYDLPCFITCEMPEGMPPVAPPPSTASGQVTFGCLNRATKITSATLDAWSQIMDRAPDARLFLKDGAFDDPAARSRMRQEFEARGVEARRIIFAGMTSRRDHLAAHGEIDIALDPFPANGGVTTCEAVAMGVPVVALAGPSAPSRSSASLLSAVGLADWIGASVESYVDIAVERSRRLDALNEQRLALRGLYFGSPVGDPIAYTRAAEAAFRDIWQRWCADRR